MPGAPSSSVPAVECVRGWYEDVLGWATAPGTPLRLRTGLRFDVLDVPAGAGRAALGRLAPLGPDGRPEPGFPVAVRGDRMLLLVAAGSAEEVPGLLEWLEWGSLPLDLTALGAGGLLEAPPSPGAGADFRGAAEWLRPPEPGREVESSLPALSTAGWAGEVGGAPGLVRLVHTLATQVHRVRLGTLGPRRALEAG
ncbi:SCO3374 family protein [Streptomyces sp. NPDC003717]|uniref:SCO3374 family protein n=1 Tax=Streptomyces sp. NPDC003717 TaxID=3154276 RepID=UPI00339E7252